MKPIQIQKHLNPVSHLPGTRCLVPYSAWELEAFPTLVRFRHLVTGEELSYPLNLVGPVFDFTVELDLEKGCVYLFGTGARGYERYTVSIEEPYLRIVSRKGKQRALLPSKTLSPALNRSRERLSLGSHKTLDWELVKRRRDLTEIFPVWFQLGQMVPSIEAPKVGTAALLREVEKREVVPQFLKLFMAGFQGILSPRLHDELHQGIVPSEPITACPLILLTEGAKLIRSLFFQEEKNMWSLLPVLPPEFHAGRMTHLRTSLGDEVDLEWSKKLLRRATIRPVQTRTLTVRFQKAIKSYRVHGKRQAADTPLQLEVEKVIHLDRFEG